MLAKDLGSVICPAPAHSLLAVVVTRERKAAYQSDQAQNIELEPSFRGKLFGSSLFQKIIQSRCVASWIARVLATHVLCSM